MNYKLQLASDPSACAQALAQWISQQIQARAGQAFHLALAGGNTPVPFFEAFSTQPEIPWQQLWLYWSDERCVPPNDPQSNYGLARKHLLSRVYIPKAQIERLRGELDPEAEALRYSALLRERLPLEKKIPILDLILLGLGDDGHTASLFPGDTEALASPEPIVAVMHPVSGQLRLSMSPKLINQARQVAFLVTGSGKAKILKEVLQGPPGRYPAQAIQAAETYFFVDSAAAAELQK